MKNRRIRFVVDVAVASGLCLALAGVYALTPQAKFESTHVVDGSSDRSEPAQHDEVGTPAENAKQTEAEKQRANENVVRGNERTAPVENGSDAEKSSTVPNIQGNTPSGEKGSTKATPKLKFLSKMYGRRTEQKREKWIVQYGGTDASERAVRDGLNWLARHQADDGHWGSDCLGHVGHYPNSKCEQEHPCAGPSRQYDMAHTGLALLAFQAGGHYDFNKNKYSKLVSNGLDWLVEHQLDDGALIGQQRGHYMYEHGIATFALAEACALALASGEVPNSRYFSAATKAISFIESQQHNDGGWRYTPQLNRASDTSVSGWQVLALKTARSADISVSSECLEKIENYFKSCEVGSNGRTGYQGRNVSTEATTGVGMLVHQFLLNRGDSPLVKSAAPYLADYAEKMRWSETRASRRSVDYYLWYNVTLAMFQAGGEEWKRWNDVVREAIINRQEQEGCVRGSWAPRSQWGRQGGRVYTTALAILTLEVYYRFGENNDAVKTKR